MANGPAISRLDQALSFFCRLSLEGQDVIAQNEIEQLTTAPPEKRYYTDDELCEMWGVSKRTTARWREQQLIGYLRAPGSQTIRYSRQHVAEFEKRLDHKPKGRQRD
jgi:hypothetical protein